MRRIIVVLTFTVLAGLHGCSLCTNTQVGEYWSPKHSHRLVVFERSCGATTGFSTHVSLLRSSGSVARGTGNAFVADDDHGSVPLGESNTLKLGAVWLGEGRVVISYPAKARVFHREPQVDGVSIQYNPQQ